MHIQRIAAFSDAGEGGNPAGVVICEALPRAATMQAIATSVGYSETAFAARCDGGWRVRYFAPQVEVPFCGHATIALGAALARQHGNGIFALTLNDAAITVEGRADGTSLTAALQSPPTRSQPASPALVRAALDLFAYAEADLDPRIPPALVEAGARHLVLALADRERLRAMRYALEPGRTLMNQAGLVTIMLVHAQTRSLFGALRDLGWPHGGAIDLIQGEDMGMRSLLRAEFTDVPGASIRVSGAARFL